jgi:hypothetical protein
MLADETSLATAARLVPRSATRTAGPPPKQLDECIDLWLLKNSKISETQHNLGIENV